MTALDRYRAATQAWRDADTARDRAAKLRAYALADMAASGLDDLEIDRRTRLSLTRVRQLIDKAHQEEPHA